MNTSNIEPMISFTKNKAAIRQAEVLEVIQIMKSKGMKITFYSVAKMTGASRSYLYSNDIINTEINKYRSFNSNNTNTTTNDTIHQLKKQIQKLKKENTSLKKYKEKYEQLNVENAELKKQLEVAYKY